MAQPLQGAMWKQLLQRSARKNLTLQGQIQEMLVSAILGGHLKPGAPVPSSRELAFELGVGRITVVLAYQQLADEGYLESRERKGHFVSSALLGQRMQIRIAADSQQPNVPISWAQRLYQRPSAQRSIVKPANWQKSPYPFLYGQFDESLFPTAAWRDCCLKALSVLDIRDWAPDQITRDDESLVEQICTRVLPRRGVWATREQLIITVGAQHALYMVADLLMRESTRVGIEDPCYPDARNIFSSRTAQIVPLPVDDHGLMVDNRLHELDYLYATPSHQCPTGVTMPLHRREQLLGLADAADLVIIEDDFESENNFSGNPIPALKSLDRNERVIYIGSLSKSMAPGLRIGYIVAAPELISELRALPHDPPPFVVHPTEPLAVHLAGLQRCSPKATGRSPEGTRHHRSRGLGSPRSAVHRHTVERGRLVLGAVARQRAGRRTGRAGRRAWCIDRTGRCVLSGREARRAFHPAGLSVDQCAGHR